ncbi:8689_t:CDS:1 [Gigaspora rosea]|nr:8689_t:CDS:1 [Gigaspora rosea]
MAGVVDHTEFWLTFELFQLFLLQQPWTEAQLRLTRASVEGMSLLIIPPIHLDELGDVPPSYIQDKKVSFSWYLVWPFNTQTKLKKLIDPNLVHWLQVWL